MTNTTDIAMMKRDIEDLREANEKQRREIDDLKALDTKRMRTAVLLLGGAVLSLLTYIWTMLGGAKVQ